MLLLEASPRHSAPLASLTWQTSSWFLTATLTNTQTATPGHSPANTAIANVSTTRSRTAPTSTSLTHSLPSTSSTALNLTIKRDNTSTKMLLIFAQLLYPLLKQQASTVAGIQKRESISTTQALS